MAPIPSPLHALDQPLNQRLITSILSTVKMPETMTQAINAQRTVATTVVMINRPRILALLGADDGVPGTTTP